VSDGKAVGSVVCSEEPRWVIVPSRQVARALAPVVVSDVTVLAERSGGVLRVYDDDGCCRTTIPEGAYDPAEAVDLRSENEIGVGRQTN